MKELKQMLWLATSLVLIASLIVPCTSAVIEHSKRETVENMSSGGPIAVGESATGVLDETQQSSDYQRGYQAGYDRGLQVAYQWMITKILEQMQMAGIPLDPLEGPKIKQAVDALTPKIGDLE